MNDFNLPLILEPSDLHSSLGEPRLLIIDLSKAGVYQQQHLPGAVHIDFPRLTASRPPVMGLLPAAGHLRAHMAEQAALVEQALVKPFETDDNEE